jgi:hypothetical protein
MPDPFSDKGMISIRICKFIPFGKDVYDIF